MKLGALEEMESTRLERKKGGKKKKNEMVLTTQLSRSNWLQLVYDWPQMYSTFPRKTMEGRGGGAGPGVIDRTGSASKMTNKD